ncbi:glutathione peroxidase [Streptococcus oralis subsp. dentisani]|nr:glutathione peroxidase [Streptococcus oralis subsp. dentisani]
MQSKAVKSKIWKEMRDYGIIKRYEKEYLWTFQKFVKKLTQIVKN